jgi:hypothetical protein
MEFKTVTELSELAIGDRFYKLSDKTRKVWSVDNIVMETAYGKRGIEYVVISNDLATSEVNPGIKVVFLRHI